jgi:bifunctional DNA-binding transcriptional regulator/antitoxin component of YhaV-PrlF toxin-antitoxin module
MGNGLNKADMDRVVAGLPTKSAKIRALGKAGYKRQQIADYLKIRYQHVRNVLVEAEKAGRPEPPPAPPRQEWTQVGADGRVVIPAAFRRLLGIEDGGPLLMVPEDGEVRLMSRRAAIRRAQDAVAKYVPKSVSLVDELIAERRRESSREERDE